MRKTVAPAHRSFFSKQGVISFEDVLSPQDVRSLKALKPSSPSLLSLVKKKQLAEIAFELTGKAPLRIASVTEGQEVSLSSDEDCALLISLETGQLIYTKIPYTTETPHLILILTARFLDVERHPVVYRRECS